jgi:type II secretion system protein L
VVLIDADRVYARRPGAPPIVLQATPLAEALALATSAAAAPETHAIIYLTPAAWAQHKATIEQLRDQLASIKVQLLPDGTLPLLAQQAITRPPVSLLQGRYAAKSSWTDAWRAWRLAAILAGCLIGLNLLGKGVQIWRLGNTEAQLDAAIEQVFREAMPGEQNAIDARRRMEARLLAIRGGAPGGTQDLLEALGVLGVAVAQVSEASLEALSFRSGVLDLKVAAKDVGSLERLRQIVTERGMIAELQSSNQRAEGVEGRIQIRAQGAS